MGGVPHMFFSVVVAVKSLCKACSSFVSPAQSNRSRQFEARAGVARQTRFGSVRCSAHCKASAALLALVWHFPKKCPPAG